MAGITGATAGQTWAAAIIPDATNRERDDFYPTPPIGTHKLLEVERFEGSIWECACGDGAISRELEARGRIVVSTDLIDRGYGQPRVDFLMEHHALAPNIITNPPFKHWLEFCERAAYLTARSGRPGKSAMLGRLACLEGIERRVMFERTGLSRVWVFSRRLPMARGRLKAEGESGGLIAFAWFVWDSEHPVGEPWRGGFI